MRGATEDRGGDCQSGYPAPACCGRQNGGRRARKGWIRGAILALLAERPMHGYEMISELSQRTGGAWNPSPGAVYPALQLLADEGLIDSETEAGRRRHTLTEAGRRALAEQGDAAPPWASMIVAVDPVDEELRQALRGADLAAMQVLSAGTPEQKERASEVLSGTRRALYRILADSD